MEYGFEIVIIRKNSCFFVYLFLSFLYVVFIVYFGYDRKMIGWVIFFGISLIVFCMMD